ncbi:DUF4238 domain-containing protein [Nonlabens marinus]|uniref:DUF4238 domain-containing protein n=1 Tax=Nonlabens marinus S1-08 TaxID=1454201 RepID=W8VRX2_9FLAO|nr:DUF4238 domain-containing protein [Nonlabens marinus]BAO55875.1 hypothetical protein NMS_1866 [Nonlabens marinus S1-08]
MNNKFNSRSSRHHYLPVFYLKGFLNRNKKFYIFDVEQQTFKKNSKEFSPKSYFFENNANTVFLDSKESDFLEFFHSKLDNMASKIFSIMEKSTANNRYGISEVDIPVLKLFISQVHGRLPESKKVIQEFLRIHGLKEFGIIMNNDKDGERENGLSGNNEFQKGLSLMMAFRNFYLGTQSNLPYSISSYSSDCPKMISDNPIIFKSSDSSNIWKEDLVFPLTGTKLFIASKNQNQQSLSFKFLADLIMFKQARKHVGFSDTLYLYELQKMNDKLSLSIEELKKYFFTQLN